MTDDTFSPVLPRYAAIGSASPKARTDIGIAFESLEAAEFYLVNLTALILYDADSGGVTVPEALELDAMRLLLHARRNSFEALRALARQFNRVESDEALFASGEEVFSLLQGLDRAVGNVRRTLEHLNAFSPVLAQILEKLRIASQDPQDIRWWHNDHNEKYTTAINHMNVAREALDKAIASALAYERAPWISGVRRQPD